jgi:site-specific DNA recombinase
MKPVAIYARVSSERQKEQETIASQVAALEEYARSQDWVVPRQWQFLDEGYSGASLARPGLDRLRDAAAEGQMETVVVLSPDRLSRKYAYQILLLEELDRQGTEVVFVHSPPAKTPEEQLLLQVQGMIAEYERAQIVERTRRGKRHQARQGSVNVLSGAPYGYRYVKKTDASSAYYEVLEGCSAQGVRSVHAATGKHRIRHAHSE